MKIRTDFVTNSSSSSFLAVSIQSKTFVDLIQKYKDYFSDGLCRYHIEDDCFELFREEIANRTFPETIDEVVTCLIQVVRVRNRPEANWSMSDNEKLHAELNERAQELVDSIQEAEWRYIDLGYGGDLVFPDKEYDAIIATIAKEKGCTDEEVTTEDFYEYIGDANTLNSRIFTYRKGSKTEGGKGIVRREFRLE